MLTVHIANAIPNLTVFIKVAEVEAETTKKLFILLSLREKPMPGTVLHDDKILPGTSCDVKSEYAGQEITLLNHDKFKLTKKVISNEVFAYTLEGLQQ